MRTIIPRLLVAARRRPIPYVTLIGIVAGLVAWFGFGDAASAQSVFLVTLVAGGLPIVVGTLRGMFRGQFAADIVAALAISGALITGEYLAGCVIVLMQSGGEAVEDYGMRRARHTLEALLARAPQIAHRRRGTDVEDVRADQVQVGDRLIVSPGEIVPVDGLVVEGSAAIDESALTGEPLPVLVKPGGEVLSGSICLDAAIEVSAVRPSSESQYQRVVQLVQVAQSERAPIVRLADRYAVFFTPLTLGIAGLAWLFSRDPTTVLAVLVVATPCPLILATPIAFMAGINRAGRRGIIVKGGAAAERLARTTTVVFDKTGTLTTGTPVVERLIPLDSRTSDEALRLAAGLEQLSTHPIGRAITAAGRDRFGQLPLPRGLVEAPGQGVSGRVDGHLVDVGSLAYAGQKGLVTSEVLRVRESPDVVGASVAVVGVDNRPAGLIVLADPLRAEVRSVLDRLHALGIDEVMMLTGDDEITARAIAAKAGIAQVRANLLPEDKAAVIQMLRTQGHRVVMVGDGINDAPALATATVGIAMGARGAAVCVEAADVVVMTDDLSRVGDALLVGQQTLTVATRSIWLGMGVSGLLMVIAAFGYIPPTLGAFLQEMLDVAVILFALTAGGR